VRYHLNAVPLQRVYERRVKPYKAVWAAKMTGLKSRLEGANMPTETVTSTIEQAELEIEIAAPSARVWREGRQDSALPRRHEGRRMETAIRDRAQGVCGAKSVDRILPDAIDRQERKPREYR
jgi:hypothetical protein